MPALSERYPKMNNIKRTIVLMFIFLLFAFTSYEAYCDNLMPLGTDLNDVEDQMEWYRAGESDNVGYYVMPEHKTAIYFGIPIKQIIYTFIDNKLRIISMYYDYDKYSSQFDEAVNIETGVHYKSSKRIPGHVWFLERECISNRISENNSTPDRTIGVIDIYGFDYNVAQPK